MERTSFAQELIDYLADNLIIRNDTEEALWPRSKEFYF